METLLEQQRRYHEERERLMDAMTKESLNPAKPVRSELESVKRLHFYDNVMGFRGLHFLLVALVIWRSSADREHCIRCTTFRRKPFGRIDI